MVKKESTFSERLFVKAKLSRSENIIMIDATMDNKSAGTVSVIEPRFASDFPKSLSAHDIGLKDLIESVALLGSIPKIYLITVTIDKMRYVTKLLFGIDSVLVGKEKDIPKLLKMMREKISP